MRILARMVVLAGIGPIMLRAGIVDAKAALAARVERKRLTLYDLIAQVEAATAKLQVE